MRILLIEDDAMIGESLARALGKRGMRVDWARTGHDGEEALTIGAYALVLLDLGLPGRDGLDLLRGVRAAGNRVPILIVTARDDIDDRVTGLDIGADDYVVKPFDLRELVARIHAVLRRHGGRAQSVMQSGDLALDLASHELCYRGTRAVLPAREFALMRILLDSPGAILAKEQIEERLYGWGEEIESNAIDVLIYSIRKKFGKEIIRNVRGAGWMVKRDGQ